MVRILMSLSYTHPGNPLVQICHLFLDGCILFQACSGNKCSKCSLLHNTKSHLRIIESLERESIHHKGRLPETCESNKCLYTTQKLIATSFILCFKGDEGNLQPNFTKIALAFKLPITNTRNERKGDLFYTSQVDLCVIWDKV